MMLVRAPSGTMGWSTIAPADLNLTYGGQRNRPLQLFEDIVSQDGSWHITDVVTAKPEKGGAAGSLEGTGYELGTGLGITLFGVFMATAFSRSIALP